jgi:ribose/xylose/arabinose/galactoside ABC-type transport system permease subunit
MLAGSGRLVGTFLARNPIFVGILGLVVVTTIIEPQFATSGNVGNIVRQFGTLIFVSLGMTFVIMAGFLDLSVGGIISLVAVVIASQIDNIGQGPAILLGLLVGLTCGVVNSALILKAGATTQADSLFITYGMSLVFGAIALMFTQGATIYLSYSVSSISIFQAINSGSVPLIFFSIPVAFVVFLVCVAVLLFIERRTYMGRAVLLTGANKTAARLAGVRVDLSIVLIYAISGLLSAIASVVLISQVTLASPVIGAPYLLSSILAVVVGGTALAGGRGSVLWTAYGALLLILLNNCLDLLGVSTYIEYMFRGVILVLAIWLDSRRSEGAAVKSATMDAQRTAMRDLA